MTKTLFMPLAACPEGQTHFRAGELVGQASVAGTAKAQPRASAEGAA